MPRPLLALEIMRAQLFGIDADRKKSIDDTIDYFGAGHIHLTRDPRGEPLLDEAGPR